MAKRRKNQRLDVYQDRDRVGVLERAVSGAISFTYSEEWLTRAPNPISLNLPMQEAAFRGAEVSAYFDNLLPDSTDIRDKIAQRVKSESSKTFDLLAAIGHDCVGALQFTAAGDRPSSKGGIKARAISNSAVGKILNDLGFYPLGMGDSEPAFRISIAGAQEKTALLKWKGKWHLPLGTTPTTHLFKPPMGILHNGIDLSTSVENEWLCLRICALLGLKVPKVQISLFNRQKCLVVERFDRLWEGENKLLRLPQEDICQALGFSPTKKYEADGGPGILRIMDLLNASDERETDRQNFMRSQVIFYLLAATDGHAKNFSVLLSRTGFKLTPFYDVMSIFPAMEDRQMAWQKGKLAMAVGDSRHYQLKTVASRHFLETAKRAGFAESKMAAIMRELKELVLGKFEEKIRPPASISEKLVATIVQGMKKQAARL